jgi:hypothetical protein
VAALRRQQSLELTIASAQPPVSARRLLRRPGSRQPRWRADDRPGLPCDLDVAGNHDVAKSRRVEDRRGGDRTGERTGPPSDFGPSRRLAGPSGACSTAEPNPRLSRRSTRLASRGGRRGRAERRRTLHSDSGRPAPPGFPTRSPERTGWDPSGPRRRCSARPPDVPGQAGRLVGRAGVEGLY